MTLAPKVTHGIDFCKLCRCFTSTKDTQKSELEWISNASCNESSDWRRQNVQCPYEQLQQSSIFRIQLCVSTLSKDQQQCCLVAFAEHFPTTRNLSWFALLDLSAAIWHGWLSYSAWPFTVSVRYSWISHGFSRSSWIARSLSFAGDMSTNSIQYSIRLQYWATNSSSRYRAAIPGTTHSCCWHTWSTSTPLCLHRSPGSRPTLFQTFHHRRPSFSGCRLTDLELTIPDTVVSASTLRSFQHQLNTFFISTILYLLAL